MMYLQVPQGNTVGRKATKRAKVSGPCRGPGQVPSPPGVTGVLSVKWGFFLLCLYHGFAGGMGEAGQRNSSWTPRSNARM